MTIAYFGALIAGLYMLLKGADWFLSASKEGAKRLGVNEFLAGLSIVALGTSVPELAASIVAALKGASGMAIGNVLGSNIANVSFVLGLGALAAPIAVSDLTMKRDAFMMMIFSTILFFMVMYLPEITQIWGALFLLLFVWYWVFVIETYANSEIASKKIANVWLLFRLWSKSLINIVRISHTTNSLKAMRSLEEAVEEDTEDDTQQAHTSAVLQAWQGPTSRSSSWVLVIYFLFGLSLIVMGAKVAVWGGIGISDVFGISDSVIGLIIIAMGTSLPEFGVTIVAAKKKMGDMILGTLIGSNISNMLLIIGTTAVIRPIPVPKQHSLHVSSYVFELIAILVFLLLWRARTTRKDHTIGKRSGLCLVVCYMLFLISTVLCEAMAMSMQ